MKNAIEPLFLAVIGLALIFGGNTGGCTLPSPFTPNGPRTVLIVHEQNDDTVAWGAFTVALRTGETGEYIKAKGHTLEILDKDVKDENGQPSPLLAKFAPFTVPELLIVAGEKAIHREKCPATADAVLAVLKANGG